MNSAIYLRRLMVYSKIKESIENVTERPGNANTGKCSETMRDVQKSHSAHADVQGVSGRNTGDDLHGQIRPSGTVRGGQRNTVRPEESGEAGISSIRGDATGSVLKTPHEKLADALVEKYLSKSITFNFFALFKM